MNKTRNIIAEKFERAKQSGPELMAFLEKMPKGGDLHNHLDGVPFSENVLMTAKRNGLRYDLRTHEFTHDALSNTVISLEHLQTSPAYFRAFRENFSTRAWYEGRKSGRDQFFAVFARTLTSGYTPGAMLADVIRSSIYQNIQYQELIAPVIPETLNSSLKNSLSRFSMDDLEAAYQAIEPALNMEAASQAIGARLDGWAREADERLSNEHGTGDVTVRYLAYALRHGSLEDFFVSVAAAFLASKADDRVVGLNIVGTEDQPDAIESFHDHMKIIDFFWRRMGDVAISLHAGELSILDATPKSMRNRIRTSIDLGHARRIGHGVSISWEEDVHDLLEQMATNRTLVEICLSSNEIILDVKGSDHPFNLYRRFDVPLSICTDDEGISRSTLTMEYIKAIRRYDLTYHDVLTTMRNSLEYSFLTGESLFLDGNFDVMRPQFSSVDPTDWQSDRETSELIANNPKLRAQTLFEQSLHSFEESSV